MVAKTCIICNSNDFNSVKTPEEFDVSPTEKISNDVNYNSNQPIPISNSYEFTDTCTETHETNCKSGGDGSCLVKKRELCECFELSPAEFDSIFKNSQKFEFQLDLCSLCKDMTVKLSSQLVLLRKIQLDISAMKAGLCLKVISCITSHAANDATTSTPPEITTKDSPLSLISPVTTFRQFIYNRYSPHVSCKRIKELKTHQHSENATKLSCSPSSVVIGDDDDDEDYITDDDDERDSEEIYYSDYSDQRHENESGQEFSNDNQEDTETKISNTSSTKLRERNNEQESKMTTDEIRIRKRKRKRRIKSPSSRQHTFEISAGVFQFRKWKFQAINESSESEFKCSSCECTTSSRSRMLEHINSTHNTERFKCSVCKRSWKSQRRLDNHQCTPKVTRRIVKTQELPNGKIIFNGTWEYEKVNDVVGYKCGICEALKKTKMIMNRHIQERHADPQRFVCELCGRGFGNKRNLSAHQETHTSDPTTPLYQCEECGGIFPTQGRLYFHRQSHVQWTCGHCQKTFKYKNGLVRHQKQAGHPETFVKSTRSSARIAGEEDCSGEILKCCRCQKVYQTKETLAVHQSKCRGNSKLTCEECGTVLSNIFIFRRHVKRHKEKQATKQQEADESKEANKDEGDDEKEEESNLEDCREEEQSLTISKEIRLDEF